MLIFNDENHALFKMHVIQKELWYDHTTMKVFVLKNSSNRECRNEQIQLLFYFLKDQLTFVRIDDDAINDTTTNWCINDWKSVSISTRNVKFLTNTSDRHVKKFQLSSNNWRRSFSNMTKNFDLSTSFADNMIFLVDIIEIDNDVIRNVLM